MTLNAAFEQLDASHPDPATPRRSVVVPIYDEPRLVWLSVVARLLADGFDEVVLAADCPDEETRAALKGAASSALVSLSVSEDRRGKGGAIADGLAATSGSVVGYVDADGAVDVGELDRVYRTVEDRDDDVIAVGSRDAGNGRGEQPALRRVLAGGYRRLARRVTGASVSDFQCGAKAFPREAWERVAADMAETGFAFDTELIGRLNGTGVDVEEVPIDWQDPGDSVVRPVRDTLGMLSSLGHLYRDLPSTDGGVPDSGAEPLRLALVSSHPPNRGHLAEYGEELAAAYAAREDVEPVVLARKSPDAPAVERRDGYEIRRVWERDSGRSALALFDELADGDYDAVQFNVHMTYFGTNNAYRFLGLSLPAAVRLLLGYPVVTTLHDMLEVLEEDELDRAVGPVERAGARAATQLALCSHATTVTAAEYRDCLERRYLGDGVVHVPHGTFARADGGTPSIPEPLRILQFGFLDPTKDVATAVAAFRGVHEVIPDAELVIAGDSHPDHPGYRERLVERFGDTPGVRFTGYVEEDRLDEVWRDASLVVMPYRTSTGVSGVYQLAKSYGKPVVAYDTDGMRTSTVETGGTAAFVPPGDSAAMADRIVDLWTDRDRLAGMARENAAAAAETTMAETAERMLAAFAEHTDVEADRLGVTAGD